MATNFRVKVGKIGLVTFIRCHGIQKQIGISHSDFKRFNDEDLATLCKTLVNLSPVTPKFTRDVGVHPLVDQHSSYIHLAAPLLDTAAICTSYVCCGRVKY